MANMPTDLEKQTFVRNIVSTLFEKNNLGIMAQFYLTHYCDLRCPGCYMAAGPHRSRAAMPVADIDFYLSEFFKLPYFTPYVVFSGGEIFTLPVEYLEYNIKGALDLGLHVQIKTNGMWARDARRRDAIFNMLRNLPTTNRFSMAVSVDDKIHPRASADCFVDIASRIGADKKLSKKVALKSSGFRDGIKFFDAHVINNPRLDILDFWSNDKKTIYQYQVGDAVIESFFDDFVDVNAEYGARVTSDITINTPGGGHSVVLYFHPDGTVGFENAAFQSIGRVPYIDAHGGYKSINTLVNEIAARAISDYAGGTHTK
ncbi:radical SAM protein [bacterium]|nr:radical SAM protein [bacterium]